MRHFAALVVLATAFAAGGTAHADEVSERMYSLASALTRLTAAVESAVRYKNVPSEAGDDMVLELATRHDRALLTPFERYRVRIQRQGHDAVVLVCGRKHDVRLLEDAGCSAKLDRHHWRSSEPLPCEFTLDVAVACARAEPTSHPTK